MNQYLEINAWQVALAALLILVNGIISILLKLNLEKTLAIASVRTVVQLLLVGMVLEWVFGFDRWYVVVGLACVMTLIAGLTAASRGRRPYVGVWLNCVVSIWASAWLVTAFALFLVFSGTEKWYQPQYAIPLIGMVLGNILNGITLGLNSFTEAIVTRRDYVESLLAVGATRWEAAREPIRDAMTTGMTPIINSMMIVGLVSLPGMMTGQLFSGMDPLQAVKYQIVIMFLIASATAMGTVGVVVLTFLRLFNADHQFLRNRIKSKSQ
jgi:putative ABC transport system permease protein